MSVFDATTVLNQIHAMLASITTATSGKLSRSPYRFPLDREPESGPDGRYSVEIVSVAPFDRKWGTGENVVTAAVVVRVAYNRFGGDAGGGDRFTVNRHANSDAMLIADVVENPDNYNSSASGISVVKFQGVNRLSDLPKSEIWETRFDVTFRTDLHTSPVLDAMVGSLICESTTVLSALDVQGLASGTGAVIPATADADARLFFLDKENLAGDEANGEDILEATGTGSPVWREKAGLPSTSTGEPQNQSELALWLDGFDADLLDNDTLESHLPVSSWKNKGSLGSAGDVSQATVGSKPYYLPLGINGHPAIQSTTSSSLSGTASAVAAQAARHVFLVTTIEAVRAGYVYIPRQSPTDSYALFGLGADSPYLESNNDNAITALSASPTAGVAIIEYAIDGTPTHLPRVRINGVEQTVINTVGTGLGTETGSAGTSIGFGTTSTTGEVLVYSGLQTWDTVQSNYEYLSEKWDITVTALPVNVIPLGDSLTYGLNDETSFGGYRGPLYAANSRLVPFGLRTDGGVTAPKDHHQGTSGTDTTTVLANIATYLAAAPLLDAVLLHLGTNATEATDAIYAANMVSIINAIFAAHPKAKIFVMRIGVFGEASLLARAAALLALLQSTFPSDPRVIWIDPDILPLTADYWSGNGVHPGHGGYMAMAGAWATALAANGMGP